ncbi:hypothetical protein ABVT39_027240 [Epinephelus coioides]
MSLWQYRTAPAANGVDAQRLKTNPSHRKNEAGNGTGADPANLFPPPQEVTCCADAVVTTSVPPPVFTTLFCAYASDKNYDQNARNCAIKFSGSVEVTLCLWHSSASPYNLVTSIRRYIWTPEQVQ